MPTSTASGASLTEPAAGGTAPAVLVAGGTGALGIAVTRTLLRAGHPVTATWRSQRERDAVEDELSGLGQLTLVQAELTNPATVDALVSAVTGLGAVVNLVGGYTGGKNVAETDLEDFERMLRLNLVPGFLLAHSAMPRLAAAEDGSFVAVSARAALRPFAGAAGYITAKAGVLAFIQALHAEYANQGVRCNAIIPSVIDTPANRRTWPNADHSKWVPPEEVARVVRFLVSDDSAATSGAAIPVYGRT
jgi:NAD(P)-dependent dehydrogenase (short-subunit alcohol dehydrogenase family)